MKRLRVSLQSIAARDNLLLAVWKAARGKRLRPDVAEYLAQLEERLAALGESIVNERAPEGSYRVFSVRDPKLRTIVAAGFHDRVLHHAILNLTEHWFERTLLPTSFACRPGKGVHAAVAQVQRNLRRGAWFVQVDIDAYFASIEHARLLAVLERRFAGARLLSLFRRILAAGPGGTAGIGLPIGMLTSQHFANVFLDGPDRALCARPEVLGHVRYMDDIFWCCATRHHAAQSLEYFRELLRGERGLRLKPSARIGRSRSGLTYCGFKVRAGEIRPSARKLRRYRDGLNTVIRAAAGPPGACPSERELQRALEARLATLAGTTSGRDRARVAQHVLGVLPGGG